MYIPSSNIISPIYVQLYSLLPVITQLLLLEMTTAFFNQHFIDPRAHKDFSGNVSIRIVSDTITVTPTQASINDQIHVGSFKVHE